MYETMKAFVDSTCATRSFRRAGEGGGRARGSGGTEEVEEVKLRRKREGRIDEGYVLDESECSRLLWRVY